MQLYKIIISFLLLLTYSFGFAHNFIPHNHVDESETHVNSHGEDGHHHHHDNSSVNHEHVSHAHHDTEDFYDLLFCFSHDTHNHKNDYKEKHYILAKTSRISLNKSQTNKVLAVLFSPILKKENNEDYFSNANSHFNYLSPQTENTSLRGPPFIS
jgi:hypothetical protein